MNGSLKRGAVDYIGFVGRETGVMPMLPVPPRLMNWQESRRFDADAPEHRQVLGPEIEKG